MFHRILCSLLLLTTAAVHAETARVQLAAYRVSTVLKEGQPKEQLVAIEQIKPGELIEYQATYSNGDSAKATNVQLTVPVPEGGLIYVDGGAQPAAVQASVDGKTYGAMPLTRIQTLPDGRQVRRPVPASEIRFLRWDLGDVAAGANRTVRARMQLPALNTSPSIAQATPR